MKDKILSLLKESDDFISGQKLSDEFGITRAAIWKYINSLKSEGYSIESVSRKGYKLISSPDILTYEEIKPYLKTTYIGRTLHHYDSISSTNTQAKVLAETNSSEGTILISEEQTQGRGRLGRSWVSPKYTSISMSLILTPNISPIQVAKVTQVGAAAVALACEEMNIDAYVKWPNDIIINGKKVCGILTEMNAELNKVNYVVMGMGVNVNIDSSQFPDDIKDIATSLKAECKKEINRKELVARILNNFEILYDEFKKDGNAIKSIKVCKNKSIILNRTVNILRQNNLTKAKVIDINNEGELIVEYENGKIEPLISGEVSIRGENSYI